MHWMAGAALAFIALAAAPQAGAQSSGLSDILIDAGVRRSQLGADIDFDQPATRRIAVVIGNYDYQHAPVLLNSKADASAMTTFLREQGFQVMERFNLDRRGFEDLLRRVLFEVGPDTEVVFYFAGHGIQIGRRNYLLPVDANLSSPYDATFQTLALDTIVDIIGARSRLQLIILDSCRTNPFDSARMATELDPTLYELRSGFSAISAPVNSLIAYSTSPGHVAYDGADGASPFTAALVRLASVHPSLDFRELLDLVRRDVYVRTDRRQVPWESSTLVEPFVFGPRALSRSAEPAYGRARGLGTIVAELGTQPALTTVSSIAPVNVASPLERRISLGGAIAEALQLTPADTVTVEGELVSGRLVRDTDGSTKDYRGEPVARADLATLVYEYLPEQRPALDDPAAFVVTERLSVSGTFGTRELELVMRPDPCDVLAGDWLDPEGVGLARYPNELDPEAAIPACRSAIERSPETGRFHYQLGRALQAALKFDQARTSFQRARDLGHTRAAYALGDLTAEAASAEGGRADEPAPPEALEFYAQGVEEGDPYAYHALGKQLLRNGRTEASRRHGFELLSQASELGHTFAMNELGYYFLDENSEHSDPKRGLRYLIESAARNDIYGYNNLGIVYDKGLGGAKPDPEKALQWYIKAFEGGHPYSAVNIGRMYYNGKFGESDPVTAIEWYDRGLQRGVAWGGANAAWIIVNDRPKGFSAADAAVRAAKAAVLRDADAADQARRLLQTLGVGPITVATQMLIREFEPSQVVDGVAGRQTLAALASLSDAYGLPPPPDDPLVRLLLLAKVYWRANGIRIDLL